ncbi:hypothetical protein MKZ24_26555 [Paenibacillus sp. FSL R7-0297]|uniref:hypothetical protein n=1 Tax=unclassified Paenibacillus TaxID=185978 RepID=UPI0004F71582|nr:hypothetical protein [Paenibacillus sp. FSL R5-0912]AIQ40645.1 hypothetical protein R50912_11905 [Paenibacillus sp. FSL R5-0912]
MKNRFMALFALLMLFLVPQHMYAGEVNATVSNLDQDYQIQRFKIITNVSLRLFISSSGIAEMDVDLTAFQADKTSIVCNLQQYKDGGWTTLKTFSNSINSNDLNLFQTWAVAKGNNYRIEVHATAYLNGTSESTVQYYYADY